MAQNDEKKAILPQIVVAVVIALLVGGTSPWWWKEFFGSRQPSAPEGSTSGMQTPPPADDNISGTYLMDNQSNRIIVIKKLYENRYRMEESSSPWPWEGEATLDGGQLIGQATFRNSLASMKVEGTVRGDKSIVIAYKFITADDGGNPHGRVDNHVWYQKK